MRGKVSSLSLSLSHDLVLIKAILGSFMELIKHIEILTSL